MNNLFHTDKSNAENLPVLQTNQLRNDTKNFNLSLKHLKKEKKIEVQEETSRTKIYLLSKVYTDW